MNTVQDDTKQVLQDYRWILQIVSHFYLGPQNNQRLKVNVRNEQWVELVCEKCVFSLRPLSPLSTSPAVRETHP